MACAPSLAASHSGCPICGLTITQYGPFDANHVIAANSGHHGHGHGHHGGHHHNHSIDSTMNGSSSLASLAVAVASSTLSPSPSSSSLVSLASHHHGGSSGALSSMLTLTPRIPLRQLSNAMLPLPTPSAAAINTSIAAMPNNINILNAATSASNIPHTTDTHHAHDDTSTNDGDDHA
jgi:hypothetical protein